MRAQVLRESLAEALKTVSPAISTRSTLPVLANVHLSQENGRLIVTATDLDKIVSCSIGTGNGGGSQPGAVTAPAKELTAFVRALNSDVIDLVADDDGKLRLLDETARKPRATMRTIPGEEFPLVPEVNYDGLVLDLPADKLAHLAKIAAVSAASDESRPTLTGVNLVAGESLSLAATDGFRLSVIEYPGTPYSPASAIIPAHSMALIARIGSSRFDRAKVYLDEQRNRASVVFDEGAVILHSQLVQGSYPDYQSIVPGKFKLSATAQLDDLLYALNVVRVFLNDSRTIRVIVNPELETIKFVAVNTELGEAQESVAVELRVNDKAIFKTGDDEGNVFQTALNLHYFLDALNALPADRVVLDFTDEREPVSIKGVDPEFDVHHILMPMIFG